MKTFFAAIITSVILFSGCKKEPGEGGQASVSGHIWTKYYNPYGDSIRGEYPGSFEDVYIIFGDEVGYGEKTETNPEGAYEFRYLRPGKYTVYTYSKIIDPPFNPTLPDRMILKEFEIKERNEKLVLDTMVIYDYDLP